MEKTPAATLERDDVSTAPADAPPPQITICPTNRCIYECRHCDRRTGNDADLPILTISRALTEIARRFGPREISIAGGEPLLYGGLVDLVAHAHEAGHFVNVVTNGALLSPALARELARWGLNQIVVSLDGFRREHDALRRAGAFRAALAGVDAFRRAAPRLSRALITVITRLNAAYLLEFTRFALDRTGARSITFQAFVSHQAEVRDRAWYLANPLWPDDPATLAASLDGLAAWAERDRRISTPPRQLRLMKRYFADPTEFLSRECLAWRRIMLIEADGAVKYCTGVGAVGNLNERSFGEIWDSPERARVRGRIRDCRTVCHYLVNCGFVPEGFDESDGVGA